MPNENLRNSQAMEISKPTVKEFANLLLSLPQELQNRPFTCSGYDTFYLHNRKQEGVLTVDEEEFID